MQTDSDSLDQMEDLDKILVDEAAIKRRLKELGEEISATYEGRDLAVIGIINGAVIFVADLIRELNLPIQLDCVRVATYKEEDDAVRQPEIIDTIRLDVKGLDVLLIDDVLDTGKTLAHISKTLHGMGPASLRTCVLLEKETTRAAGFKADFVGFTVPDEFVVGYGLDFAERYRQLPCIGVLKPELQNPPQWG
jgi:hypoxanthine phosphoribosyltransferase